MTFLPLYYVGYNGLPRRYHDYPNMYLGWNTVSTLGHITTVFSIFFFFTSLSESKKVNKVHTDLTFFTPRLNKRLTYYIHKFANLKFFSDKLIAPLRFINVFFSKQKQLL